MQSRFAVNLEGETIDDMIAWAKRAEAAGFGSVWAGELHRTPAVTLAAVGPHTRQIRVGAGIFWAFTRSPFTLALTALDLDDACRGRFILGLGTGVRRLNEQWQNVTFGNPVRHLRECVQAVRLIMDSAHRGAPIRFQGEYYDFDIRGYRRPRPPVAGRIPVYLAAVNGAMIRLAGEVGDGLLGHPIWSLAWIRDVVEPNLARGLSRAGRTRDGFHLNTRLVCAISNDVRTARRAAAGTIAFHATVRTYERLFTWHGFGTAAQRIQQAFRQGDIPGMIDAVPEEMIDTFSAAGHVDQVRRRVSAYAERVDSLMLTFPHNYIPADEVHAYQEAVFQTFGR